ncbi:hypothetical protein V1511DRAFT_507551 [Dipodascopsis uninucleata]
MRSLNPISRSTMVHSVSQFGLQKYVPSSTCYYSLYRLIFRIQHTQYRFPISIHRMYSSAGSAIHKGALHNREPDHHDIQEHNSHYTERRRRQDAEDTKPNKLVNSLKRAKTGWYLNIWSKALINRKTESANRRSKAVSDSLVETFRIVRSFQERPFGLQNQYRWRQSDGSTTYQCIKRSHNQSELKTLDTLINEHILISYNRKLASEAFGTITLARDLYFIPKFMYSGMLVSTYIYKILPMVEHLRTLDYRHKRIYARKIVFMHYNLIRSGVLPPETDLFAYILFIARTLGLSKLVKSSLIIISRELSPPNRYPTRIKTVTTTRSLLSVVADLILREPIKRVAYWTSWISNPSEFLTDEFWSQILLSSATDIQQVEEWRKSLSCAAGQRYHNTLILLSENYEAAASLMLNLLQGEGKLSSDAALHALKLAYRDLSLDRAVTVFRGLVSYIEFDNAIFKDLLVSVMKGLLDRRDYLFVYIVHDELEALRMDDMDTWNGLLQATVLSMQEDAIVRPMKLKFVLAVLQEMTIRNFSVNRKSAELINQMMCSGDHKKHMFIRIKNAESLVNMLAMTLQCNGFVKPESWQSVLRALACRVPSRELEFVTDWLLYNYNSANSDILFRQLSLNKSPGARAYIRRQLFGRSLPLQVIKTSFKNNSDCPWRGLMTVQRWRKQGLNISTKGVIRLIKRELPLCDAFSVNTRSDTESKIQNCINVWKSGLVAEDDESIRSLEAFVHPDHKYRLSCRSKAL